MKNIKAIITDIEGTTTSISFVHDVLFPFSKERLPSYLETNFNSIQLKSAIELINNTLLEENGIQSPTYEDVLKHLLYWMEIDRKHPALKEIQGYIWERGYIEKGIEGHIYPDVLPQLDKWFNEGVILGIYSSGSIHAQRLLFGNTANGDINHYFKYNFDTSIGFKQDSKSYEGISRVMHILTQEILFLSDVEAELDAAKSAGYMTCQLVREGTLPTERHENVKSFDDIVV